MLYDSPLMWPQSVIRKQRGGLPENEPLRTADAGRENAAQEIQELRRRISEFQAAAVREKRREEVLRESEERFRRIFEEGPLGMAMSDPYFHFIRANAALCRMLGYTEKELTSLTFKEITHPDHVNGDTESLKKLLHGDIPFYRTEKRYVRKDKQVVWGEVTVSAIRDGDGQFQYFLAMVEDITPRKKANGDVRENEEKYRMLFESANDAIFLMDFEQFIDCNSNTLDMFGCGKKGDVVGHSPWDYSPEKQPDGRDSREKAREHITAALDGKPQRFLWQHCRKDRTRFDAEVSLTSLVLAGKKHLLAVVRDITGRTQAERLQNAVYQISQAADRSVSLDDLYRSVHENISTVMPATNFYIALYDPDQDLISFPYFVDEEDPPPNPLKPGKGLTEYVIRTGRPLLCDEATDNELRGRGEVEVVGAPSAVWLGVPLNVDGKTIGVMTVQHYSDPKAYGERELRMLEYVSSQVARSIERKQAEKILRENAQRLSLHIQQTPLAVIEWDKNFRVLQWNLAAERIFGHSAAEAVGRHASFIIPARFQQQVDRVWNDLMTKKGGERSTNENVTKDGRTIFCEWYNTSLISSDGQVIGVASLAQDVTERARAETKLLQSVKQLRTTLKAAIDSLASAIEMRDPYTAGHQERVTRLASAIAEEMGLNEDRIEGIQIAGIIHDIGKLYVPAEILSKPTKLSDLEYSMIKMHSQVGYTILSKIDFPWPIAQIVHQHHETINGSGYPRGLSGKDILLEARILCVADVVEAMSSHRPYRPALGMQAALDQIAQKRGILYDREVVDACLRLFREKKFKFD
jgi:PAS domain S-box-containing protein/putative nucleotidyltransferase with HDIG domain